MGLDRAAEVHARAAWDCSPRPNRDRRQGGQGHAYSVQAEATVHCWRRDATPCLAAFPQMIWIAALLIGFVAIGLARRTPSRRRLVLVFIVSTLTAAGMFLSFGSP